MSVVDRTKHFSFLISILILIMIRKSLYFQVFNYSSQLYKI